jgi:Ca2+:H+ antiporter
MAGLSTRERIMLAIVLVLAALAGVGNFDAWPTVPRFGTATVALAGLAWVVSLSTGQVGQRLGASATGILHSTLGNLPELFVVVFALQAHELVVAQTAIVGSLLVNALLVLGLVIVAGSRASADGTMRFRSRLPNDTATLLIVTVFIIVVVGVSLRSGDAAGHHVKAISSIAAVCLLAVYISWAVPYLRNGAREEREQLAQGTVTRAAPRVSLPTSLLLLAGSAGLSAFVSDWFVSAIRPAIASWHISQAFAGLVIVAIAGNAVENVTGIAMARAGNADLAISVVKNSVAQVAAFVFPLLVLVSLALATPLTFALAPVYIGALAVTALAIWQVTGDGEALAFEGWALVALYVVLAVVAAYE